ncbi:hypothetical protein CVD28_12970 [Bacillus sp. M6-12]|nr:hypothetical protein CVD28_12970 [Bacillus sp. M6-12]
MKMSTPSKRESIEGRKSLLRIYHNQEILFRRLRLMAYKNEEKRESLDHLQVPASLETFIAELPERYENGDINPEIENQIDKEWHTFRSGQKKTRFKKKMIAFSLSSTAAIFLLVGSVFVSPAMAEFASSIPYLSSLFKSKPLYEEVQEALDQENYEYGSLGMSISDKEISVRFEESEDYYKEVKPAVEDLITNILKARNNDAYKVRVFYDPDAGKLQELPNKSNEIEEQEKDFNRVTELTGEVLKEYGHPIEGIGVREGKIYIDYIPSTEKRIDEMKSDITNKLKQEGFTGYKIKLYLYNPEHVEREGRILPLFHTITEGLTAKAEYKVSGVGYTNKRERFYMVVRTTVSSKDSNRKEVVERIEQAIIDFLQTEEAQKVIQDDIYEIEIESKDKKVLKTIKN